MPKDNAEDDDQMDGFSKALAMRTIYSIFAAAQPGVRCTHVYILCA